MDLEGKLVSLPYSYDDFVNFAMQCIQEEDGVEDAIREQFRINPDSDTNDITKVLCDCLGIGEPLEIVDDEDSEPAHRQMKVAML